MQPTERFAKAPLSGYFKNKAPKRPDPELTSVGPGTPCGEYFRRFWQPVAMLEELGDVPLRLRILGEDLVLFRDLSGKLGLLELHCTHRGASLEFGKIVENGIKCGYHGWHYGVDGSILDAPTHTADRSPCGKVCQGAYPVREYKGLAFAYMGPPDKIPDFPIFDFYNRPGLGFRYYKHTSPCNWLQIRENGIDPLHVNYLHLMFAQQFTDAMTQVPTMEFHESPLGMLYNNTRRCGDMLYLRSNEFIFPNIDRVNGMEDALGETVFDRRGAGQDWVVPIDDTNSVVFSMLEMYDFEMAPATQMNGRWDRDKGGDAALGLNRKIETDNQHGERSYAQRQKNPGDFDAWASQGPIHSHEDEYLGASDAGVILYRKLIRQEIRKVQNGEEPKGVTRKGNGSVRTHGHNTVMKVPQGATPEEDREIRLGFQRHVLQKIFDGQLGQETADTEKLAIAREIVKKVSNPKTRNPG